MTSPADSILAGLDDAQRQAAQAVRGPVLIRAGAGSGKTRTVTHRIAYAVAVGAQRADRGLAVTFTAKAAGEMRSRVAGLGVTGLSVMTFHAAALRQLKHFWPKAVGGPAPMVLSSKASALAETAGSLGLPRDRLLVRDVASEVEWAKVSRVRPADYASAAAQAGRTPPGSLTLEQVAAIYSRYRDLLTERGQMDFEDVLGLTVGLLGDRPDLADQVRQRYRWITVDEYQDVSAVQQTLLKLWLGDSDDVCVVGDPAQTIYTFAGASRTYIDGFGRWFPNATTVTLDRTYRCSPQVAGAANKVLALSRPQPEGGARLVSTQPDGTPVAIRAYASDHAEAEAAAAAAVAWHGAGVPLREIALLVRINAATAPLEDALAAAGVPYTVTGGERFFNRPEIREAVVRLRGAANGAVDQPTGPVISEVLVAMGFDAGAPPQGRGALRDRWESLAALRALADDVAASHAAATVGDLVAELDRRASLEAAPVADAVTLATLHAAKGLEWEAVWIAGLQEGTLPISHADTDQRVEEERRLLYVGMTRARRELVLSWSASRGGDRGSRRPSRFLRQIDPTTGSTAPQSGVGGGPRKRRGGATLGRCRVCGKGLPTAHERVLQRCRTCPEEVDLALLERLKSWRKEQSAASGAPAYTVFTDVTLQAIAELRPGTEEELLAVSGVGQVKLERYGQAVLGMVREGQ